MDTTKEDRDLETKDTIKIKAPTNFEALKCRYETLRDELKLRAHLLGMDARQVLDDIERAVERMGSRMTAATQSSMRELIERLETLKAATTPAK